MFVFGSDLFMIVTVGDGEPPINSSPELMANIKFPIPQKANGLISTPTHGGVGLAAEFIKKNRQVSRYLRPKNPGHRRANLGMRQMISS